MLKPITLPYRFLLIVGLAIFALTLTGCELTEGLVIEVDADGAIVIRDSSVVPSGPESPGGSGGDEEPQLIYIDSNIAPSDHVTTGDWWTVMFSDPNTQDPTILNTLVEYIDNAETSIDIAAFEFNLTEVAEALIAAHNRGVRVRWVTDDEHGLIADEEKEGRGQFAMIMAAGIPVRDDARSGLMHNKFIIFDGQIVWTGSTNITQNGVFRNNNNVIVIASRQLARIYEREFLEMWDDGQFGITSPSTVDQQFLTIAGTEIQVMFASEDNVMDFLVDIVSEAEQSIRFMAFSFTYVPLGDAMRERYQAGVDVSGIFELRASETEYSEMPAMFCLGMPVRQDGNPGTFHHKVLVIDEYLVVTGSLNFSQNADRSNDENILVIGNEEIAAAYLAEFERRYPEGRDPFPERFDCP